MTHIRMMRAKSSTSLTGMDEKSGNVISGTPQEVAKEISAQFIKSARLKQSWTQVELAAKLGMTQSAISKYENMNFKDVIAGFDMLVAISVLTGQRLIVETPRSLIRKNPAEQNME
ncbi:MAG: helix-turn-helix transcriptional regulator [Alphaproteobacteria bacterium]